MDVEENVDESELKEGFEIEGEEPVLEDELPVDDAVIDPLIVDDAVIITEDNKEDEDGEDPELIEYMFGDEANAM